MTGPGRVWIQTLPFSRLADRIMRGAPRRSRGRQARLGRRARCAGRSDRRRPVRARDFVNRGIPASAGSRSQGCANQPIAIQVAHRQLCHGDGSKASAGGPAGSHPRRDACGRRSSRHRRAASRRRTTQLPLVVVGIEHGRTISGGSGLIQPPHVGGEGSAGGRAAVRASTSRPYSAFVPRSVRYDERPLHRPSVSSTAISAVARTARHLPGRRPFCADASTGPVPSGSAASAARIASGTYAKRRYRGPHCAPPSLGAVSSTSMMSRAAAVHRNAAPCGRVRLSGAASATRMAGVAPSTLASAALEKPQSAPARPACRPTPRSAARRWSRDVAARSSRSGGRCRARAEPRSPLPPATAATTVRHGNGGLSQRAAMNTAAANHPASGRRSVATPNSTPAPNPTAASGCGVRPGSADISSAR